MQQKWRSCSCGLGCNKVFWQTFPSIVAEHRRIPTPPGYVKLGKAWLNTLTQVIFPSLFYPSFLFAALATARVSAESHLPVLWRKLTLWESSSLQVWLNSHFREPCSFKQHCIPIPYPGMDQTSGGQEGWGSPSAVWHYWLDTTTVLYLWLWREHRHPS